MKNEKDELFFKKLRKLLACMQPACMWQPEAKYQILSELKRISPRSSLAAFP